MVINKIGTLTELVAEGTNYITEKAEMYDQRTFSKRKVLTTSQTSDMFRDATEKEYTDYQQNTPPGKPKRTALTPMFETVPGVRFNDKTGFYELNGLTDITEREMCDIYQEGPLNAHTCYPKNVNIRTNILRMHRDWNAYNGESFCWRCPNLEVLELGRFAVAFQYLLNSFYECPKLRRINGSVTIFKIDTKMCFKNLPNLEFIGLYKTYCDLPFGDLPKLNLETFNQLLQYPGDRPIVVTVHPEVYAKLTDPNNVEWSHIVPDALTKQITFATV